MDLAAWSVLAMFLAISWRQTVRCADDEPAVYTKEAYIKEMQETLSLILLEYDKRVRPAERQQVDIKLHLTLFHIRSFDVARQELEAVYDVDLRWYDDKVRWDPTLVPYLNVNVSLLWSPDVECFNRVVPTQQLYTLQKLTAKNDGTIWWHRRELITTQCTPSNTSTHDCPIIFGFNSHLKAGLGANFFDPESNITVRDGFSNSLWDIDGYPYKWTETENTEDNTTEVIEPEPEPAKTVTFVLPLKLKSLSGESPSMESGGASTAGQQEALSGSSTALATDTCGAASRRDVTGFCALLIASLATYHICKHDFFII